MSENTPAFRNADDEETTIITRTGDLILVVEEEEGRKSAKFRCDSGRLKQVSPYFNQLLGSKAFQEGQMIAEKHADIQAKRSEGVEVGVGDLPHIKITDMGQVSLMKSIKPLMTDFLRILHGNDILTAARSPPAINLANLAIVADRFDAISVVGQWSSQKKSLFPRTKTGQQQGSEEAAVRQKLLTYLLFSNEGRYLLYNNRVITYSSQLIIQDSVMWKAEVPAANVALWWDIPRGIEDEMQYRRSRILQTISSLLVYLLSLYSSKERQCRLGYDSSPQCDSFQLGEFVKHLARVGVLDFGKLSGVSRLEETYEGDIKALMRHIRGCPSYQVDSNHSHCGPKKLLSAGLDFIQDRLNEGYIGICLDCWKGHNGDGQHFWSDAPKVPYFNGLKAHEFFRRKNPSGCDMFLMHELGREFFNANEVNWESLARIPHIEKPVLVSTDSRKDG